MAPTLRHQTVDITPPLPRDSRQKDAHNARVFRTDTFVKNVAETVALLVPTWPMNAVDTPGERTTSLDKGARRGGDRRDGAADLMRQRPTQPSGVSVIGERIMKMWSPRCGDGENQRECSYLRPMAVERKIGYGLWRRDE